MKASDIIVGVLGICLWVWLFKQILSPAGFLDCTGCRKGAIRPGCPLHDPQERRGLRPEAMSATKGMES